MDAAMSHGGRMRIGDYEIHPAAMMFPMMSDEEYHNLIASIAEHGLRNPIVLFEGQILDGRNRMMACIQTGVEPAFADYLGDDPVAYVVDENLHRRHLTETQRAAIAEEIATMGEGRPKGTPQICGVSREDAATMLSISSRLIDSVRHIKAVAPQLVPLMRDGLLTAGAASRICDASSEVLQKVIDVANSTRDRSQTRDAADDVWLSRPKDIKDVKQAAIQASRDAAKAGVREAAPLSGKYRVIYADPPWLYTNGSNFQPCGSKAAAEHYPCMSVEALSAMDIPNICEDDAVLWMWATVPLLPDALAVMAAWGFIYKTNIVWDKIGHNMGTYLSVRHEHLLIGTRGSCCPLESKLLDSVVSEKKTEHSVKPERFRAIIDELYPDGNRIELFSRATLPEPWKAWGNQC